MTVQPELPIEERFHPDGYQNPGIGRGFDPLGWRGSVISSGEVLSRGQWCDHTLAQWLACSPSNQEFQGSNPELPIEERFHPDGYQDPGICRGFDPLGWRGSVISSGKVLSRGQCVITLWLSG